MLKRLICAALLSLTAAAPAQAGWIFAGSWNVNDGAHWTTNPLAYSGIGAANLLFGAGTYAISTVDADASNIDNLAWYNIIGIGSAVFAEDYFRGTEGVTHYQDVYVFDPLIDTVSTYVNDFQDPFTINYAFRWDAVPEPASTALLGLGLLGLALRRRIAN